MRSHRVRWIGQTGRAAGGLPLDDLQFAFEGFHQGGEAFHPVAVVAVDDAVDGLDLRLVDVPANHALESAAARLARHGILESGHEIDRVLGLVFQVLRE